jgi:hypothetical protein
VLSDAIFTPPDGSKSLHVPTSDIIVISWQNVPEAFAYTTLPLILKLKKREYFFKNFSKTTLPGLKLYQNLLGKFVELNIWPI